MTNVQWTFVMFQINLILLCVKEKINSKIQIMFIHKCIYQTAALEEMTHMNGQNQS